LPVGRLIVGEMKIQSANFEAIDSERVKVLGDLNLHTVSAYLAEGKSIISNAQARLCMDLSNIQVEDTSVLALLISRQALIDRQLSPEAARDRQAWRYSRDTPLRSLASLFTRFH
jgi:ABC-type transporter Mla MlaB component